MEDLGAAGHDEGDGFYVGVVNRLEGAHHLVLVHIDAALGEEGNAALGIGGFIFGEGLEFVVLVFEIADIAVSVEGGRRSVFESQRMGRRRREIPFAGQIQALSAVIPEGHADT